MTCKHNVPADAIAEICAALRAQGLALVSIAAVRKTPGVRGVITETLEQKITDAVNALHEAEA